jgi:hypothetical protein
MKLHLKYIALISFLCLSALIARAEGAGEGPQCRIALSPKAELAGYAKLKAHYQRAVSQTKSIPRNVLNKLRENIFARNIQLDEIAQMHETIAGKLSWSIPIGASVWIGSTMARNYGGVHNFFTEHNSNFVRGLGLIWMCHNMMAAALPRLRKEIAFMTYSFFGLGNIALETSWFGLRSTNDYGDLAASEYNEEKKLEGEN